MSNIFPLYENMSKISKKSDLNKKQKEQFLEMIEKSTVNAQELIYMLIKTHSLEHDDDKKNNLYGCQKFNNSIRFDMGLIPTHLRQILYNYLRLHMEEQEHENIRKLNN